MEDIFAVAKEKLFGPNVKALVGPAALILVLVALFVYAAKTGYSQISLRLKELRSAQKEEAVLEQKLEILREIEEGILAQTDVSLVAMPDRNPALWMIAQLKDSAEASSLLLFDNTLKSESKDETGLAKMDLGTTAQGNFDSVMSFLKSINSLAPVSTIERVEVVQDEGVASAKIQLSVYWADFPTKIPPLAEPIYRLTAQQEEVLTKISRLKRPIFTVLQPGKPSARENPFN